MKIRESQDPRGGGGVDKKNHKKKEKIIKQLFSIFCFCKPHSLALFFFIFSNSKDLDPRDAICVFILCIHFILFLKMMLKNTSRKMKIKLKCHLCHPPSLRTLVLFH